MSCTLTIQAPSSDEVASRLHLVRQDLPVPQHLEVLVKMLAAPINPLDLLVLQDKYPVKPQSFHQGHPIPGYDGVAEIMECGQGADKGLSKGDKIIIKRHGLGTWRMHAVLSVQDVIKIPDDMELSTAAILRMGILTAYFMLEENKEVVKAGDWIILNGGTSIVAHFLGQFAHMKGARVISVIRDRPGSGATKKMLQAHGADTVWKYKELADSSHANGKRIMLGFDAVFGAGGQRLMHTLSPGATYVSYGFLGGLGPESNISVSQGLIFVKNLKLKAFRLSTSLAGVKDDEMMALFAWIAGMLKGGQLTEPLLDIVR